MDLQLKNKSVLITGSSKGIGFAMAKMLAAEGCNVGICARNADEVKAAVEAIEAMGVKAFGSVVDVTDSDSLEAWIAGSAEALGGVAGIVSYVSAGGAAAGASGSRRGFEAVVWVSCNSVRVVSPDWET